MRFDVRMSMRTTRVLVVMTLGFSLSCTKRNPYKCNLAEPCPLAEAPLCDIRGDFGEPYHCVGADEVP